MALGKAWRFLMLVLVTLAAAGPAVGAEMNAAAINGRHLMVVKKELEAAGVKPAMDPEMVGATVLSEDDVASGKFLAGKRSRQTGRGFCILLS
jgi:hypothetical protein